MRLKLKPPPKGGDTRAKTKFLIIPVIINNELRWLEEATWEEEYHECWTEGWWVKSRWVNA